MLGKTYGQNQDKVNNWKKKKRRQLACPVYACIDTTIQALFVSRHIRVDENRPCSTSFWNDKESYSFSDSLSCLVVTDCNGKYQRRRWCCMYWLRQEDAKRSTIERYNIFFRYEMWTNLWKSSILYDTKRWTGFCLCHGMG